MFFMQLAMVFIEVRLEKVKYDEEKYLLKN